MLIEPENLPLNAVYGKERALLNLVKGELAKKRKVFTYCQYTGIKDVTARIKSLLVDEGIRADILRYSVKPEEREEWIHDAVESGTDVVIANPKLVQTGLDLYDFPTMIFYQTGYSVFTLRQASRRSWRIGQDKDVRIHYLYYGSTLQEKAMHLIGSKMEAALAIEGKFSEDGLLAMTAGEDMNTAMAKALTEGLQGEGVEQIWSKLNQRNRGTPKPDEAVENKLYCINPSTPVTRRRGRRKSSDPDQLSLF